MTTFFQHWDHWWRREIPPHALAITRICFGGFLLFQAILYAPSLTLMFSSEGVAVPLFAHHTEGWMHILLAPPPPHICTLLYLLLLTCLTCLTLGYKIRIAGLGSAALCLYFWQINLHPFQTSYYRWFFILLVVLAFSGADRTLSLRNRREGKAWADWTGVSILPQRLIALQITAVYAGVGWQKFLLPTWDGGEVLYYSLISRWATDWAFWIVRFDIPMSIYEDLVLGILVWEAVLPLGLWSRKWQPVFFLSAGIFHILIAVLLSIWWFIVLIPLYCVFCDPKGVKAWTEQKLGRSTTS